MKEREEEIKKQMHEKAYVYGENRWKRIKRTFLVLSAIIYVFALCGGAMSSLKYFLAWILVAPVMAGFVMLLSWAVLSDIVTGIIKEEKDIAELHGKLMEQKMYETYEKIYRKDV